MKIHIKKKNEGKFTASAKKAGQSVQEHAKSVLNNPNATPLQKKRANFARNAAKWKHADGGTLVNKVDWKGLMSDQNYKNDFNWKILPENMSVIEDSLINRNAEKPQRIAILSQIIPESGGDTKDHGNGATGLIGFRGVRAQGLPKDLPGQIHILMEGLFNPKAKHWTHGGKGTNVNTGKEMQQLYVTSPNTVQATKAVMKGFVRPEKSVHDDRIKFVELLKKYMQ